MSKPDWEHVGNIGVDAGLCWVGDPCYCVTPDANSHPAKTWEEFCDKIHAIDSNVFRFTYKGEVKPEGVDNNDGLGVVCRTGYGDGKYPVYVRRKNGRVTELKVVFDEEDLEEEDEMEEEYEGYDEAGVCDECGGYSVECSQPPQCDCPICTHCGLKEVYCACEEFVPVKQDEEENS